MLLTQEKLPCYQDILLSLDYRKRLEKIARKYTRGTRLSWEDAVQTAYLKVLLVVQARKFWTGSTQQFYRWAITVARYVIIDFVRKETLRNCQSLDSHIPGTELSLLDTIPDEFNTLDAAERADLILRAIEAIHQLDKYYPQRKYLPLWQRKVDGKTQNQIADELNISQGEISKRWQELIERIAELLGLLETKHIKQKIQENHYSKTVYHQSITLTSTIWRK